MNLSLVCTLLMLVIVTIIAIIFVVSYTRYQCPAPTTESCASVCPNCTPINVDTCKNVCPKCTDINANTCSSFCQPQGSAGTGANAKTTTTTTTTNSDFPDLPEFTHSLGGCRVDNDEKNSGDVSDKGVIAFKTCADSCVSSSTCDSFDVSNPKMVNDELQVQCWHHKGANTSVKIPGTCDEATPCHCYLRKK